MRIAIFFIRYMSTQVIMYGKHLFISIRLIRKRLFDFRSRLLHRLLKCRNFCRIPCSGIAFIRLHFNGAQITHNRLTIFICITGWLIAHGIAAGAKPECFRIVIDKRIIGLLHNRPGQSLIVLVFCKMIAPCPVFLLLRINPEAVRFLFLLRIRHPKPDLLHTSRVHPGGLHIPVKRCHISRELLPVAILISDPAPRPAHPERRVPGRCLVHISALRDLLRSDFDYLCILRVRLCFRIGYLNTQDKIIRRFGRWRRIRIHCCLRRLRFPYSFFFDSLLLIRTAGQDQLRFPIFCQRLLFLICFCLYLCLLHRSFIYCRCSRLSKEQCRQKDRYACFFHTVLLSFLCLPCCSYRHCDTLFL